MFIDALACVYIGIDDWHVQGLPTHIPWHMLHQYMLTLQREAKQGSYLRATEAVIMRNGMAVLVYFREHTYPLYCRVIHAKFAASDACLACQE